MFDDLPRVYKKLEGPFARGRLDRQIESGLQSAKCYTTQSVYNHEPVMHGILTCTHCLEADQCAWLDGL
jgi:hypothetical protein